MVVYNLLLLVALQPAIHEVDFRPLPLPNSGAAYRFTVTVVMIGRPPVVLPFTASELASAEDLVDGMATALSGLQWKTKHDGKVFTICSCDQSFILGVTVTGDGPKPTARRVLIPPAPKK